MKSKGSIRKKDESVLQEWNERRFQLLIENSSDVISLLDENGIITYSSPSITKVLGYASGERTGHSIFENIHPDDQDRLKKTFSQLLQKPGLVVNEITRYRHHDGHWLWMEGMAKNMLDDPSLHAIIVNFRDITDRKNNEIALQKISHDLNERVKELDCINKITDLLDITGVPQDSVLQQVADVIPPVMQYPDIAVARIELDGKHFTTKKFRKTQWGLVQPIVINNEPAGVVEIYYLKKQPETDEGSFLKEERNLINIIARKIGQIIEKRKAENELNRYSQMVATINDLMVFKDVDGRYLAANEQCYRYFKRPPGEIIGRTAGELFEKAEYSRILDEYSARCLQGEVVDAEVWLEYPGMGRRYMHLYYHPFRETDGRITGVVITARDITERKLAEDALRTSEQRFSLFMKNMPGVAFIKSNDGRYIFASATWEKLFNKRIDDIRGKTDEDIWPADVARELRENDRAVLEGGKPTQIIEMVPSSQGDRYWLASKFPMQVVAGEPALLGGVAIDVTERKLAIEALQHERDFSDALLNSLPGVVYCYDKNLKFLRWNTNFERVLGYNSDEIKTMSPLDFFAEGDKDYIAGRIQEVFDKGSSEAEADFITKTGIRIPYYFTGLRTEINGAVSLVGVGVDISSRKEAEEKLKRYTEALRTHEAQLSNAMRIARAGHWEYDVASDQFLFNDYFYALLNTSVVEIGSYAMSSSDFALKFVHPEDIDIVSREIRCAIESPDPDYTHELEHRFIDANGNTGYMAVRIFIVKDDQGRTVKTYGVNQDITGRKQSEQNLALLEFALDHAHEASYLMDQDGRFLSINEEACRSLGYTREELLGMKVTDIDPEITLERWHNYWDRIKAQGTVTLETTHRRKDGSRFPVEVSANYFEYEGKGYDLALARDISERKKAEQELAQSQRSMVKAQAIAHLGNWEWNPQEEYVTGSDELFRIFGLPYTQDKCPLNAFLERIHPDDLSAVREQMEAILIGARSDLQMNYRVLLPDGEARHVIVHGDSVYNAQHELQHIFGVIQDITAQHQAEDALRESEQRFRLMADSAPVLIWMADTEGSCTYFNQGWLDFTGKTFEQERGNGWFDGVHPDDRKPFLDVFNDAMNARVQYQFEKRLLHRTGEYRWLLDTGTPRYTSEGVFAGFIGTCIDITSIKQAESKVRESEERMRLFIERAPSAIAMLDKDMRYVAYSRRWLRDYQLGDRDITGLSHYEVFPDIPERWKEIHQRCLNGAIEKCEEDMFVRADGSIEWNRWEIVPWRKVSGEIGGIIIFSEVITDRKEAKDRILRLNRVYKMLSAINSLIVHVHDQQELFNEACRISVEEGEFRLAWIGMVNKDTNSVLPVAYSGINDDYVDNINITLDKTDPRGRGPTGRAIRENRPVICNDIATDPSIKLWREKALARGYHSSASLPLVAGGEVVGALNLYAGETAFFDDEEMKLLIELAGDISYAMQNLIKEEQLQYLSSYDSLTGLANRTLFFDHLNSVLERAHKSGKKVALLVCDLKQFRNINNVYGRQTGDRMLQETARRLRDLTADPVNIGRIASDYFALILHDIRDATGIAYMFENSLFPSLNAPFLIDQHEIQASFCGGIAVYPADGEDAEMLYRNAEAALKKAKTSNEQYLFYQPEMTARIAEILQIENKLRNALKEDQFVLHYQPKINSITNEITGLEALIRWNDPDTGLVPPMKFIPILEETGLILEVGLWAIDRAASDYRRIRDELKSAPRIAVNISNLQLKHKNFVEDVEQAIRKNGDPVALDLEITESLIMTDIEANISKLRALRLAGLGVAIDDFGTGYSSLSYISKLPIDALKIDRSFINNMTMQPESMTIVSTIITLAHSLKFKVIAEGVETEEQAKFLRLLKCDEMQGFLFSKPLPFEQIIELLRKVTNLK